VREDERLEKERREKEMEKEDEKERRAKRKPPYRERVLPPLGSALWWWLCNDSVDVM
jgi:hypothetical protein